MKSLFYSSALLLPSLSFATYVLSDTYDSSNFFSEFDAFTGADPTNGFVKFLDMGAAQSAGLYTTSGNTVKLSVDSTNMAPNGRNGVRLTSSKIYNEGLIIGDFAHMPGSDCGVWPAFWTVGPNWPSNGEIDIIEGVNSAETNEMTLHTGSSSCNIGGNTFVGTAVTSNCNINAAGQATNAGCGISAASSNSYGDGFNSVGGGVYAVEWTSSLISIWHFPRSAIPADIASGNPVPSSAWGTPQASWGGSCDIGANFQQQQIVFDTTFCGDWAGAVWSTDPVCKSLASTCEDYVGNNPSAFAQSYWEINSVKVYTDNGSSAPAPAANGTTPAGTGTATTPVGTGTATATAPGTAATTTGGHHGHPRRVRAKASQA